MKEYSDFYYTSSYPKKQEFSGKREKYDFLFPDFSIFSDSTVILSTREGPHNDPDSTLKGENNHVQK